jgi:excisionase family DNA binding protein
MSTSAFDIPEKRRFRPSEVAKILNVTPQTVYRWCEDGRLDFVRVGPWNMWIKRECVVSFISICDEKTCT